MVLKDLLIKITADVSGLKAQMSEAEKSIDGLKNKTDGLNTSGNILAGTIAGVLTAAFAQITTQVVASVLEITAFDKSLTKAFQTITGGASMSTKEFSQFSNEVQNIGKTSTIGAKDAAGALILLGKATKTPQEAMKVFKEAMLLTEAGITDMGSAASLVGASIRTFKKEGLDASTIVDILGGAALKGKLELSGLEMMLRMTGPTVIRAGISFKELMGALAILSQNGVEGRMALMGLRTSVSELMNPTSQLSKLLGEWGIKTTDNKGRMNSFKGILDQTSTAISNNASKASQLADVAGPAFTTLVEQAKAYNNTIKEIGGSRELLKQNAKELNETLPQAWDKLRASAQAALIAMGENLREPLIGLLQNLSTTLVEVSNSIDAEAVTNLGNAFVNLVGSLPAVVQGLKPIVKLFELIATSIGVAMIGFQKWNEIIQGTGETILTKPYDRIANIKEVWRTADVNADKRTQEMFKFPTGMGESTPTGYHSGSKGREAGTFQTSTPQVDNFATQLKEILSNYRDISNATGNKKYTTIIEIMKEIFTVDVDSEAELIERLKQLSTEHKKRVEKIQGAPSIQ